MFVRMALMEVYLHVGNISSSCLVLFLLCFLLPLLCELNLRDQREH